MSVTVRRAMSWAAVWLMLTAIAGGGCAVPQSQNVAGSTGNETEPVTGRNYYLYLPKGYNPAVRYPLIVSIHGMKPFDNAFPQLMTWRKICDENGWIAMAPQLKSPDMLNQFPFRRIDNAILEDEELIVASVQDVIRRFSVDTRNVMVTGWSSGGYLIHYVGARHPELFTLIVPQGANFSEDIMPDYVTEAARQTPVYIYHGGLDLPMVLKDSNAAAAWYQRHGYRSVQMDEAPGGHERHPELAARYLASHIAGVNASTAIARLATPAKTEVLAEPWLTSAVSVPAARAASPAYAPAPPARPPATPSPPAYATAARTSPPPPAAAATPHYPSAPSTPAQAVAAARTNGNGSGGAATAARPPATPGAAVASASSYSWDRLGPARPTSPQPPPPATVARPTVTPPPPVTVAKPTVVTPAPAAVASATPPGTPVRTQLASERFTTPAVAAANPTAPTTPPRPKFSTGVVQDFPAPVTPLEASPVAMPIGPIARAPAANSAMTTNVRAVSPIDPPARAQTPQVTVTPVTPSLAVAAPRPLIPAMLPTPGGDLTPVTAGANPAGSISPASPDPRRTTSFGVPQPVGSPNHTSVRIVPSAHTGYAPLTVEFRAEVTGVNSPIVRYRWRLEDKLFSTAHFGVLTFQRAGEYPIELTITDAAGNSYRNREVIRVTASEG